MTMKSEAKSTFVTLKKKEKRRNILFKLNVEPPTTNVWLQTSEAVYFNARP